MKRSWHHSNGKFHLSKVPGIARKRKQCTCYFALFKLFKIWEQYRLSKRRKKRQNNWCGQTPRKAKAKIDVLPDFEALDLNLKYLSLVKIFERQFWKVKESRHVEILILFFVSHKIEWFCHRFHSGACAQCWKTFVALIFYNILGLLPYLWIFEVQRDTSYHIHF